MDPIFILNADILCITDFCVHFDFLRYCIKILFILMAECFGAAFNVAPKIRVSFTFPSPGPARIILPVTGGVEICTQGSGLLQFFFFATVGAELPLLVGPLSLTTASISISGHLGFLSWVAGGRGYTVHGGSLHRRCWHAVTAWTFHLFSPFPLYSQCLSQDLIPCLRSARNSTFTGITLLSMQGVWCWA